MAKEIEIIAKLSVQNDILKKRLAAAEAVVWAARDVASIETCPIFLRECSLTAIEDIKALGRIIAAFDALQEKEKK